MSRFPSSLSPAVDGTGGRGATAVAVAEQPGRHNKLAACDRGQASERRKTGGSDQPGNLTLGLGGDCGIVVAGSQQLFAQLVVLAALDGDDALARRRNADRR